MLEEQVDKTKFADAARKARCKIAVAIFVIPQRR
jgi:hypothetical protein